ncbi:MAG: very short patch repair endonuclease [Sporocytophaga sp.]|nr:very short patch repair endonuclease [Sporocytophaga sp.]
MSRIKGKNTKPEILVRKFLFSHGFRFRIHVKSLPGNPDIVLSKYKSVIFIQGCFWHGHEGADILLFPKQEPTGGKQKLMALKKEITQNILS